MAADQRPAGQVQVSVNGQSKILVLVDFDGEIPFADKATAEKPRAVEKHDHAELEFGLHNQVQPSLR